ncbi:MAG: 50S ribosomal protein L28 [Alphaproteobacteria bacterium]|nr:MAG: 50S ribosomal protein L28 [Alphaproteobacteria bacterium]
MSKVCIVTGKAPMTGNNVSHANNRTKRRFLPNLQNTSFYSDLLAQKFYLRVTTRGIRTIEAHGGFDGFLMKTRSSKLHPALQKLKKEMAKAKKASS